MAYFNVCPSCGSNLDPGERCDCLIRREHDRAALGKWIRAEPVTGQYVLQVDGGKGDYGKRDIVADDRG